MTAHILALICWIMPGLAMPKPVPPVPTDAQILAEAQKRANEFCSPSYVYPEGAVPFIVGCAQTVPDCDSDVPGNHPYAGRCTGRI